MKISVDLKYCYGIKALRHDFDFAAGNAILVYAPNGAMKTSLAKVFRDISQGEDPKDEVFPHRTTVCSITNDPGLLLDAEHVFVVDPYEEDYSSERIATLLVNEELKREYESIHASINAAKAILFSNVEKTAGIRRNVEQEMLDAFKVNPSDIYSLLESFEADVNSHVTPDFADIAYQEIFNEKVQDFLASPSIAALLSEYVAKYDELIDKSMYFRKGIFNHTDASTVSRTLKDRGFFKAQHSVTLSDTGSQRKQISSQQEFEDTIAEEKKRILNDPELSKKFETIDKAITKNVELRTFRTYLEQHPNLLPELANLDGLKRKLWTCYLISNKELYDAFLSVFRNGKEELSGIIKTAKEQATDWHNVVEIFNKRFSIPFILEIANQDDVILKEERPIPVFKFKDGADVCEIGHDALIHVLCTGEKRALYILNVIFELEARKQSSEQTLVILDDIADSFDYKNKYAIIEYLKDILDTGRILFIILTHNFDFFRTVQLRLNIGREYNCLMSTKTESEVKLIKAEYLRPFEYWKVNLHKNSIMLVATIPMVRNLIEYAEGKDSPFYLKLTSLLHQKSDSNSITLAELANIFNKTLSLTLSLGAGTVLPLIFQQAEICLNAPECINLENKVVLSIAIRLAAEDVMIRRINNASITDGIKENQTLELFKIFKNSFSEDTAAVSILDQVIMMTPEPIHLNSFMYEPLIDLSDNHLKDLYRMVKAFPIPTTP
jgi:energy-coupling factor transporter ATP-binding protein EcfA2